MKVSYAMYNLPLWYQWFIYFPSFKVSEKEIIAIAWTYTNEIILQKDIMIMSPIITMVINKAI